MKIELKQLQNQFETTFLYITHDQSEALVMSDNVAVMNAGRFEQIGAPQDLYNNPTSGFVAGFVGDSNRWPGRAVAVADGKVRLTLDGGGEVLALAGDAAITPGSAVELFVRPEVLTLAADRDNSLTGMVNSLLFNGASSRILVRLPGGHLVEVGQAVMDGTVPVSPGQTVTIGWSAHHGRAFSVRR